MISTATPQLDPAQNTPATEGYERTPALGAGIAAGLSVLAIAIQGYHPYADDGGLYIAGVKRLLDPSLYPHYASFVLEQTRLSAFARIVSSVVRAGHAGLEPTLFVLHFAGIWATLFAAWLVAAHCWNSLSARLGAVSLLGCCLSLPVAGTALSLMDPYLTARSFSTPLGMFALAGALAAWRPVRRKRIGGRVLCLAALAVSVFIHPVMAVYILSATLLLLATLAPSAQIRVWGPRAIPIGLLALALAAQLAASPASAASRIAALTRTYWFLTEWEWYEWLGLLAPLAILGWYSRPQGSREHAASALARSALLLGLTGLAASLLFAHPASSNYLIARLQPLRAFHIVYLAMVLILGAELGQRVLRHSAPRWTFTLLLLSCCLYLQARAAYPDSAHVELHISNSQNKWVEAFLWIRDNTPVNALFALDSEYNNAPDEDSQVFRAIAERSAMPDRSKDGGVAAMASELAPSWLKGVTAQDGLDHASLTPEAADRNRQVALRGTGADWLVLRAESPTALPCPYRNEAVKVCRVSGQ